MYTIISPSKTQDFTRNFSRGESLGHVSPYNSDTQKIARVMKDFSAQDLEQMMHVSEKIGALNYGRFQKWNGSFATRKTDGEGIYNFSPALFALMGDVYRGFDLEHYKKSDFTYAQKHLGIISGFYGLLTPMTYMKPYRLEMGTRLSFTIGRKDYKNFYDFWQKKLTDRMNEILTKEKELLNLASVEYSKAINRKNVQGRIVDVDFKVHKGGKTRIIAIYAKRARGEMANWIIQNRIDKVNDIEKFTHDGWKYSKKQSEINRLVFVKSK